MTTSTTVKASQPTVKAAKKINAKFKPSTLTLTTTVKPSAHFTSAKSNELRAAIIADSNGSNGKLELISKLITTAAGRKHIAATVLGFRDEARELIAEYLGFASHDARIAHLEATDKKGVAKANSLTLGIKDARISYTVSDSGKNTFIENDKYKGLPIVNSNLLFAYNSVKSAVFSVQKEAKEAGKATFYLDAKLEWSEKENVKREPHHNASKESDSEQLTPTTTSSKVEVNTGPLEATSGLESIMNTAGGMTAQELIDTIAALEELALSKFPELVQSVDEEGDFDDFDVDLDADYSNVDEEEFSLAQEA